MADPPVLERAQGHLQFLGERKRMLDAFDRARSQAKAHEVETFHGTVAESSFRSWLKTFLPKRYGVCAGYIASQGAGENEKLPHYDVIVFDDLESPVLWVEDYVGASVAASRAIPAEYVRAVIEVKANLTSTSAAEAIEHLCDLRPLLSRTDKDGERYPRYLRGDFFCGVVAFDLLAAAKHSTSLLDNLVPAQDLRGYWGGHILRGEGIDGSLSGYLGVCSSGDPLDSTVGKGKGSLLDAKASNMSNSKVIDNAHRAVLISWGDSNFARFAFDLLALLNGTYESNRVSSFHATGFRLSRPKQSGTE